LCRTYNTLGVDFTKLFVPSEYSLKHGNLAKNEAKFHQQLKSYNKLHFVRNLPYKASHSVRPQNFDEIDPSTVHNVWRIFKGMGSISSTFLRAAFTQKRKNSFKCSVSFYTFGIYEGKFA